MFYLSNVHNYTLFLYNYKLSETYADRKLKLDAAALSSQFKARGPITNKEIREMKVLEAKSKKTTQRFKLFQIISFITTVILDVAIGFAQLFALHAAAYYNYLLISFLVMQCLIMIAVLCSI